ncbi:hypothetical protein H4R35_004768 [Dimargaris xerosporica]|nr:hypothetical protein H4R35_004768 [Dimargaris xerosporica]
MAQRIHSLCLAEEQPCARPSQVPVELAYDLTSSITLVEDLVTLLQDQPLLPKMISYIGWSDALHAMAQDLDVSTITLLTLSPPLPLDYSPVPLN